MFRFHRSLPNISIFHNGSSPQSKQALTLLNSALSSGYPPAAQPPRPLEFNLQVVEDPPTADQFSIILSYLSKPVSSLLSAHPSASSQEQPTTTKSLHTLVSSNPKAMKFPIVVNWDDGQAAVGDVEGVREILESIRRKRDGEEKRADDVDQPKGWFS